MKWEVTGADRQTGEDRTEIVDAETEESAKRRGNRSGILVSSARPLDAGDTVAGVPVAAPQAVSVRAVPPPLPAMPSAFVYVQPQTHHSPAPVQTIQKTGKGWKLQIALSALGVIVSLVVVGIGAFGGQPAVLAFGVIGSVVFAAWFAFAKMGAWWFHG